MVVMLKATEEERTATVTEYMMIGVDLAKAAFQVHVATMRGHVVLHRKLSRQQFRTFMAEQAPAIVVMEACGSAHYWARELGGLGHAVKLIAPQYVKPFVKLCSPRHNLTNHEVPIMRRSAV